MPLVDKFVEVEALLLARGASAYLAQVILDGAVSLVELGPQYPYAVVRSVGDWNPALVPAFLPAVAKAILQRSKVQWPDTSIYLEDVDWQKDAEEYDRRYRESCHLSCAIEARKRTLTCHITKLLAEMDLPVPPEDDMWALRMLFSTRGMEPGYHVWRVMQAMKEGPSALRFKAARRAVWDYASHAHYYSSGNPRPWSWLDYVHNGVPKTPSTCLAARMAPMIHSGDLVWVVSSVLHLFSDHGLEFPEGQIPGKAQWYAAAVWANTPPAAIRAFHATKQEIEAEVAKSCEYKKMPRKTWAFDVWTRALADRQFRGPFFVDYKLGDEEKLVPCDIPLPAQLVL